MNITTQPNKTNRRVKRFFLASLTFFVLVVIAVSAGGGKSGATPSTTTTSKVPKKAGPNKDAVSYVQGKGTDAATIQSSVSQVQTDAAAFVKSQIRMVTL